MSTRATPTGMVSPNRSPAIIRKVINRKRMLDELALAGLFQAQFSSTNLLLNKSNTNAGRRTDAGPIGSVRLSVLVLLLPFLVFAAQPLDDRTRIAVEALLKVDAAAVQQNAKLKETVSKLLDRTAGTAEFVKLVQHFKVAGQEAGLLAVAVREPRSDFGVEAMRI